MCVWRSVLLTLVSIHTAMCVLFGNLAGINFLCLVFWARDWISPVAFVHGQHQAVRAKPCTSSQTPPSLPTNPRQKPTAIWFQQQMLSATAHHRAAASAIPLAQPTNLSSIIIITVEEIHPSIRLNYSSYPTCTTQFSCLRFIHSVCRFHTGSRAFRPIVRIRMHWATCATARLPVCVCVCISVALCVDKSGSKQLVARRFFLFIYIRNRVGKVCTRVAVDCTPNIEPEKCPQTLLAANGPRHSLGQQFLCSIQFQFHISMGHLTQFWRTMLKFGRKTAHKRVAISRIQQTFFVYCARVNGRRLGIFLPHRFNGQW